MFQKVLLNAFYLIPTYFAEAEVAFAGFYSHQMEGHLKPFHMLF